MAKATPQRIIREGTQLLTRCLAFGGPSIEGLDGSLEGYDSQEIQARLSIVYAKLSRACDVLAQESLESPSGETLVLLKAIRKLVNHANSQPRHN